MVTYVDHVLQRDDGSATRYIGINAASSATGMHTYRISGAPISVEYTQDYYYYDDGEEPSEPVEMAMCYTTGEEEQLTVKAETPWEIKTMRSEGPLNMGGRVEADIWMQEDGLHGLVRNNTSLALKEGVVITTYGFVSVPALQPGESASFAILEAPRNSADSGPADGVMSRSAGYTLYTVTNAALGLSDDSWDVSGPASMRREIINAAMNRLTDGNYYSSDQTAFLYSAEAENPLPLAFYADGKQVENAAGMSVFNIEINYLPVGKTGVIYRMPGMDQAVRMTTDEFGKPAEVADDGFPRDDYYSKYHDLSENPVFRFIPECPKGVRITSMSISVPYYDAQVRCFLLNAVTGEWDEIRVNQNIKNPEQYLDENGQLFCRFEPAVRTEYGVDIPTPGLSLEGRDPNAEN